MGLSATCGYVSRRFYKITRAHLLIASILLLIPPSTATALTPETFTLQNGMRVVVLSDPKVPLVTQMVWYDVGSNDDPEGYSGTAHSLEHMMFKENSFLSEGEFSEIMAFYGASENAFTSKDFTAYYQTLAKAHLPIAMLLESIRMQHLTIEEKQLQRELNVVLEERNMRVENNPVQQLNEQIREVLYGSHPYSEPIIGYQSEIPQVTREIMLDFYRCYYAPEHALLVLAGDITLQKAQELAAYFYGDIPKGNDCGAIKPQSVSAIPAVKRHITYPSNQAKSPRWIYQVIVPQLQADNWRQSISLMMLEHLLSNPETGLLYEKLVKEKGLATRVYASYSALQKYPSVFYLTAHPTPDTEPEAIATTTQALLKRIAEHGVAPERLKTAKTLLKASSLYIRDGAQQLGFLYGQLAALGLDLRYVEQWPDRIDAITQESIQQAARMVLESESVVTGWLQPEETE